MVQLDTLGTTTAHGIRGSVSSGRPLGALVFLSLQRERVGREELAHFLWDAGAVRSDRHSLSQLLYTLRRCLPPRALVADAHHVQIDSKVVSVDYNQFIRAFRAKEYATAVSLYKGAFLAGFPIVSEAFDEWRIERAAASEAAAIEAYRALVGEHLASENLAGVPELCARALEIAQHDPFFIRVQIETLAAQNELGAALASFELYRRLLARETGSVPSWMTADYVDRLSRMTQLDPPAVRTEIQPPFVGRLEHLKTLRDVWQQSQHVVRAVRLVGESGIGKTRLLNQFVRRTVIDGARVHLHKCAESESLVPYAAIAGLLLSNYRREVTEALTPQLRGALASVVPEISYDGVIGDHHQRVVFEAFAQYFASTARNQRLVLALDDFQWSDDASRAALSHVLRRLDEFGSFVLLASRPESAWSDELIADIVVEPMSADEVSQLVQHHEVLYGGRLDRSAIYRRSGGNPFFVLQLARYPSEESGTNLDSADISLPVSISRVLQSRVNRLSEGGRLTAAAAAVFNRPASVAALRTLTGLSEIEVATGMDELVRFGIAPDAQSCQFVHDLMRRAAYANTSIALRQVLHRRAAKILRRAGAAQSELAHHLEIAGLMKKAWFHARAAAQEATRLSAYREADAQYQRMLRCSSDDLRIRTEAEYLSFLFHANRLADAYSYVEAAEEYAKATTDRELHLMSHLVRLERDHLHSLQAAHELIEEAQQGCPDLLPRVLRVMIDVFRGGGQGGSQLKSFCYMLRQETSGKAGALRHAAAGLITGVMSTYNEGLPIVDQAVTLAERSRDSSALLSALFARGAVRSLAGMCDLAEDDYQRVLQLSDELGSGDYTLATACNLAVVYMEQDKLDAAEECGRRALALGPARRPFAIVNLALLHYRRGEYAKARKYVELLENSAHRDVCAWIPVQALALKGLCSAAEEDWLCALELHKELEQLRPVDALPVDLSTIHAFAGQVIAFEQGSPNAASYLLAKSAKVMELDYLAGARLAVLAGSYLGTAEVARVEAIVTPIFQRATKLGATAVGKQAARVLESFGVSPLASPDRIS